MTHKIIDLTRPYTSNEEGFTISPSRTIEKDGWNATTLTFYSHSGTHMDAPIHFNVSNETIDQIDVSNFIGKAWVIDVRSIGKKGLLEYEDMKEQLKDYKEGDSLIIWTGWSKHYGTSAFRDELPRVSEGFAHWCADNKVKMLAVEPPSVADVNNMDEVTKIHKILLQKVIVIEGLINIESLSTNIVELIALPLKIKGGDGSPARVIAIEKYS